MSRTTSFPFKKCSFSESVQWSWRHHGFRKVPRCLCWQSSRSCSFETCCKCLFVIILHFRIDSKCLWCKISLCFAVRFNSKTWTICDNRVHYFTLFFLWKRRSIKRWHFFFLLYFFLIKSEFSLLTNIFLIFPTNPSTTKTTTSLLIELLIRCNSSNHYFLSTI